MLEAIFNSNDYKRGKDDGYKDGCSGKDMSFVKMGLSLKYAIHGNRALDTYTRGYKDGYTLGSSVRLIEQSNTYHINANKINITTMPGRGIDGQIDLLEQMKAFLVNLSEQFDEAIKTQTSFLNGLDSEGIDVKMLETFEDYLSEKRDKLNNLISLITDEEIPYVEQNIRHLEDTPR